MGKFFTKSNIYFLCFIVFITASLVLTIHIDCTSSSDMIEKIATLNTFTSKEEAEKFSKKLKAEGFEVDIRKTTTKDKETIYKVFGKRQYKKPSEKVNKKETYYKEKKDELQQPVIIEPREREEFRGISKIKFLWKDVPGAQRYHLILAKDRIFKNIIHENSNIVSNSYTIENLDYGTYFFKMRAFSSDNKEGPFSETISFVIVPPIPYKLPLYFIESK